MNLKILLLPLAISLAASPSLTSAATFVVEKNNQNFSIDGNGGAQQGQQIYLWSTNTGNANQQWVQIDHGDGYYSYKKQNTNLCWDGGNGGSQGQAVTLETCDSGDYDQHWSKVKITSGTEIYRFEKRNASGWSIDGSGGGANRQAIYLWDSSNTNINQQWDLIRTDVNTPPTPPPTGTTTIPTSITNSDLWDLEGENPNPLVNSNTLEFVPLEAKITTPNGNGWRHEYKIASDRRIAMTDTYEQFKATIKVDMSTGGKTIVAQHHAGDTGTIMKLYVADSSESGFNDSVAANGIFDVYVRIRNTSGVEEKKPLGTIRSGESFSFEVINDYGVVKVSAFGQNLETEVEDDSESYLKFGNYLQSQYPQGSEDCGESGDSDSFEECYDDIGITEAKITMTNVSYERIER